MSRTRFLLALDTILFVTIMATLHVPWTGLPVHEWLGLAIIPLIVTHVLYGWRWIASSIARLRAPRAWRLRVNFFLNAALFAIISITIFSGVMDSVIVLPILGMKQIATSRWDLIHIRFPQLLTLFVGLHIAMNWRWVVGVVRRYVLTRPTARGDAAIASLAIESEEL